MEINITFEINSCKECPFFMKDYYGKRCYAKKKKTLYVENCTESISDSCPLDKEKINKIEKKIFKRGDNINGRYIYHRC